MMIFNRHRNLFFAFFPILFLIFPVVRGEESLLPVQNWKKDGVLFRFSAEKEDLIGIWEYLARFNDSPDSAGPLETVDFTLFRHQGPAWKGKTVRIAGRLLRTAFIPDAELPSGGYYETWFLFDDEKSLPARLLTLAVPDGFQPDLPDAPEPVKEPGKILYRQERIKAAAVYYRQTAFSDGDDLYTAPTLVAENFSVVSKPADSADADSADETSADAAKPFQTPYSWQIAAVFAALFLWLIVRRRFFKRRLVPFAEPNKTPIPDFDLNAFTQAAEEVKNNENKDNDKDNEEKINRAFPFILLFAAMFTGGEGNTAFEAENPNRDEPAGTVSENSVQQADFAVLTPAFWESITGQSLENLTADDEESVQTIRLSVMDRLNRNISDAVLAVNLNEQTPLPSWPESFGRAVRFSGKVENLEPEKFGENLDVYRVTIIPETGSAETIFTCTIPEAWRKNPASAAGARTGGTGIVFRPADSSKGEEIFAKRIALYDDSCSAGRLGIDVSIFDGIHPAAVSELETMFDPVERKNQLKLFRLTAQDTIPFYTLLADLSALPAGCLAEEARQCQAEKGRPEIPALFNHPEQWQKEAITLSGHVKRARKIPIHDFSVQAVYGLDAYYELYLFTDDSQGYPLVCCTADLPEGFPLGVGDDYRENVTLSAIFYKPWGYKAIGPKGEDSKKASNWIAVPLLIAGDIRWFPEERIDAENGEDVPIKAIITICFLLLAGFWLYLRTRPKQPPIEFQIHSDRNANRNTNGKKEDSDSSELPPELPPGFPTDFSS